MDYLNNMFVVKYRKIFYTFSVLLLAFSVFAVSFWGLHFGIDFKGGSTLEVIYPEGRPDQEAIQSAVDTMNIGESSVRQTGTDGYIIRTQTLTEPDRVALISAITISTSSALEIKQFNSVGPVLGKELQGKAIWSVILVILAIVLFITFAFRHVSLPVASWKYGIAAIIALLHDVIIPTGIYAFLGRNGGFEVDALFITAILVILGFSVHDSIVVFDRTRENLRHSSNSKKPFDQLVGESISQTFNRSINTSLTTVLALVALYIFGAEATKTFSLVLIIGIITGVYSSIFIGSPLLVTFEKWQKKK